ncbi:glycosyltransferase [Methylophaga sp.]|uniref:glycosyltransferase n=1 Tax=Methylophaga sp. TaxID=2024840 RepID=UPI003A90B74B
MRVNYFAFSFSRGGAAIAAEKFYQLVATKYKVRSYSVERVVSEGDGDRFAPSFVSFRVHYFLRLLEYALVSLFRKNVEVKHSLNLFSCRLMRNAIRSCSASDELVHVHWINNDSFSVRALGRLPEHSIITLHDEWLISGAEHYRDPLTLDAFDERYTNGGFSLCRSINRWSWGRKYRALSARNDLIITAPSRWLQGRAASSQILGGNTIELLPNPINTEVFAPLEISERALSRAELGIRPQDVVFCFGGVSLDKNRLKGGAELALALDKLSKRLPVEDKKQIVLLVFGGDSGAEEQLGGFRTLHYGRVASSEGMRWLYGMSDVTVVPSLVEAFGQVAAESLSCAVPVVCFNTSGLKDVVDHEVSGFMADFPSISDLSVQLQRAYMLGADERRSMGHVGRANIKARFSFSAVGEIYSRLLESVHQKKAGTLQNCQK